MKNRLSLLIGGIIVVVLLVYMFAFQVRYDERAVVTTWSRATEPEAAAIQASQNSGSVKVQPGLYFKWPWPVQNVEKYTTRLQLLDSQQQEQQTRDKYSLIVRAYVTWRISDPYAFFVTLKNEETARSRLRELVQSLMPGVIGKYDFADLVNTNPELLKLPQAEKDALAELRRQLSQSYGITVEEVGIRRIVLPDTVTQKVFERMRKTRERMAQSAKSEGEANATAIRTSASSTQDIILAFANRRAEAIRAEGMTEAAAAWREFKDDQEFAIFLAQLDALKTMFKHRTTFLLDARGPLDLFVRDPGSNKTPAPATPPGSAGPTAPQASGR